MKDLLTTLRALGGFDTFIELCDRAILLDDLRGPVTWTLFAPTDEAFGRIPRPTLDRLWWSPPELLIDIAEHHLVRGRVRPKLGSQWVESQQGSLVVINGDVVEGARIVRANVECSNGVLHAIDSVLCPSYGLRGASFDARVRRFLDDHEADTLAGTPYERYASLQNAS